MKNINKIELENNILVIFLREKRVIVLMDY